MRLILLFVLPTLFALSSCSSSKSVVTNQQKITRAEKDGNNDANSIEVDAMSGLDLTAYLRRIPGMQIQGSGPDAVVRVRDQRSLMGETSPLFVVDGNILGNNFASLYTSIDPNEIKRIRVLKSASETNRYGLQGGNGVLEITLKK
jgi:hypothetical protein